MIRIAKASGIVEATLWHDMLTAAGIESSIQRMYLQGSIGEVPPHEAALEIWVAHEEQAARAKVLFDAGAASQQEVDQAATAVKTTEAQLRAIEEQIRQERTELAYYRVTASTSGVVGDVPVRLGDRVEPRREFVAPLG